jgi:hypothetical protein
MRPHKEKNNYFPWIIAGVLLLGGIAYFYYMTSSQPGEYDSFASCLVASGAKMYGTWWCPHCKDQKNAFGKSWKVFESEGGYVECSTPDRLQTEICRQEKILGYPTWRFSDEMKTELSGNVPLEKLAEKTGCRLN